MNCRTGVKRRRNIIWNVTHIKFSPKDLKEGESSTMQYPVKTADFEPKELIDPIRQGSVVTFGSAIYQSNPSSTWARQHLRVKKSTNMGRSWDEGLLIHDGASGYSQLVAWETP